jgi:hypothetical protein
VIAREIDVADVGAVTARERPDVALVGLGDSSQHALDLIDKRHRGGRGLRVLRNRSRVANASFVDLATAVVDGHQLLPKR